MPQDGWLIALDRNDAKQVFGASRSQQLPEFVEALLQQKEKRGSGLVACGTAWKAIHQCLAAAGEPLVQCIAGGRPLHEGEDRIALLVRPDVVAHVAAELEPLSEDWLRQRFEAVLKDGSAEDAGKSFEPLWPVFAQVRAFYGQAAREGAAVLFVASP